MRSQPQELRVDSPKVALSHSNHETNVYTSFLDTSMTITLSALGFFGCMIIMELALEAANHEFPDLEALPYAVTLFQFGFCFFLPLALSRGASLSTFPKTIHESLPYLSLSLVVFGSTCLASMSVRYVSYPTKVVLKSAKLIPTMVVATIMQRGNNKYGMKDYLAAVLLCLGAAGYSWGSGSSAPRGDGASWFGITLLVISVCCDAFTPNIQQRLMSASSGGSSALPTTTTVTTLHYRSSVRMICTKLTPIFLPYGLGLSASELMTNANGIGCVGLLVFMVGSGSLKEALLAAMSHPRLLGYLFTIGLALATAVLCYTQLIQQAGSVVAVAVATLRKVATIILSYIIFPKMLSKIHAVSGLLVLMGILISSHSKRPNHQHSSNSSSNSSSNHK